ncbi:MAG: hypothetical protein WBQ18_15465, partial [Solirubrobacteraceae bacterium]
MKTTRAYLAGLGTASSLVLGAAVLFVLGSAVVGFNGWPRLGAGGGPATQVVNVRAAHTVRGQDVAALAVVT